MSLTLYLAFVASTALLIATPGPNVGLIVANSLAHGTRQGLLTVAGTGLATAALLALTVAGIVSLLAASAELFAVVRWGGAALLVGLGARQWHTAGRAAAAALRPSGHAAFWQGALISATNPATLAFYAAFFPQFVAPERDPLPQLALLAVTFLAIATLLDSGYAVLAGRLRRSLEDARRVRLAQRTGGALLMLLGVAMALLLAGVGAQTL